MRIVDKTSLQKCFSIRAYVEYIINIRNNLMSLSCSDEIDSFNLREGDYKKLVEESYPLAFFVKYHFGLVDYKFIQHCIDIFNRSVKNDSYDAEITDENGKNIYYLEVVYPTDGEASKISTEQMIHAWKNNNIQEMGVSWNGKILKDSCRQKGQQKYISNDEQRREDNDCIIEKILKKNQNPNYYPNTILIVSFDDTLFYINDDSFDNFKVYMNEELKNKIDNFLFLAFVSRSGKYYFEIH